VLLALAGPPSLAYASRRAFGESPGLGIQVALQLVLCSIAGVVMVVVTRAERLSLRSIGFRRPDWASVGSALGVALIVIFVLPLLTTPLMTALDLGGPESGIRAIGRLPMWFRAFVAVTSGIVEEMLYRGYAVERLAAMTGRPWVGGLIAVAAFAAAHIPFWGVGPALGADLPFGAVMTGVYLWRRDLFANAGAHSLLLLVSMLSVPAIAAGTP
jgi:membrane protease YdiL (CAAX protease family)